jgi:hypothetical protein
MQHLTCPRNRAGWRACHASSREAERGGARRGFWQISGTPYTHSHVEFDRRYRAELKDAERAQALEHLRELAGSGTLTLLTATRHAEISQATVLADLIRG